MQTRMIIKSIASFTRPNNVTAYAANGLVANSTVAGSVVPMTFQVPISSTSGLNIRAIRISKSGTSAANANFHLRLYTSSPTCANGDGGAWSTNISGYVGKTDPVIMEAFTDGAIIVDSLSEAADLHLPAAGPLYGLLVADAAYTPAANEVFTITLIIEVW